eukprot:4126755-Amphidinium_carterae.1
MPLNATLRYMQSVDCRTFLMDWRTKMRGAPAYEHQETGQLPLSISHIQLQLFVAVNPRDSQTIRFGLPRDASACVRFGTTRGQM